MEKIDLHIHSLYSDDGEYSVKELLELCRQAGLKYLSITDHNSVRAAQESTALARQMGMTAIVGVELDCVHMGRNFHLLGYNFDYTRPIFAQLEKSIFEQEQNAASRKIELISQAIGVNLCEKEVLEAAGDGVVTGELVAEILLGRADAGEHRALRPYLAGGARADNPYVNFYWDYFAQGKPAYLPIEYISLAEGVALLHEAGGIAVLAHPKQNLKGCRSLLDSIIEAGIDGIEAYSSYHDRTEAVYFDNIARQNKLLVTCGSDFHGKTKPSIPLCGHGAGQRMTGIIVGMKLADSE